MGRKPDSGCIALSKIFEHVQEKMRAHLNVRVVLEHPTTCGAATEEQWIELLNQYLPERYRASRAFVLDARGKRSRQIDIAIYDRFYSPRLFPSEAGLHIPAESVFAVFEVKQLLSRTVLEAAGERAESVRKLRRTSAPVPFAGGEYPPKAPHAILAGILTLESVWRGTLREHLAGALRALPQGRRLDLGCVLDEGAFEMAPEGKAVRISTKEEALIFFVIRLLERLREMGNAPAVDLMAYGRVLESFRRREAHGQDCWRDGKTWDRPLCPRAKLRLGTE